MQDKGSGNNKSPLQIICVHQINGIKCMFHMFADESNLYVTKDVSMYNLLMNCHTEMEETFSVILNRQSSVSRANTLAVVHWEILTHKSFYHWS